MNIVYVTTFGDQGGAQNYVLELANAFKGTIISGVESKDLENRAKNLNISYFPCNNLIRKISPIKDLKALLELRSLFKKIKPEIVHLNSSKAGVLGSIAGIGLPLRIVYTAHGFVFKEDLSYQNKLIFTLLEYIASKFRDITITVSKEDAMLAQKTLRIHPSTVHTIENGIGNFEIYPEEISKRHLNLKPNKIYIGTIANFFPAKNLELLIEAFSYLILKPNTENIQLAIIGDGPLKNKLESKIRDYNLENRIILVGKVENARSYLKAFSIFVLSSNKEGFPFVLLEAMKAKLPIIATDLVSNKEALGEAALFSRVGEPEMLATTIYTLFSDPTLQEELKYRTQSQVQKFTKENMLNKTKKVYENLLQPNI